MYNLSAGKSLPDVSYIISEMTNLMKSKVFYFSKAVHFYFLSYNVIFSS